MSAEPNRPTLSAEGLHRAAADLPWRQLEVVPTTGSTNADVLRRAEAGAGEGLVIAADEQTAGRGRLGRTWASPPGASVSVSVLLRPRLSAAQLGWLPLLTGLSVAAGIGQTSGLEAVLKWPNDVLVAEGRPGKVAGILLERSGTAACVGFGINTAMTADELPVPEASSLMLAGATAADPDVLVAACLRQLQHRYERLLGSGGDAVRSGLADEYSARCSTLGREVVVDLPDGQVLRGVAEGIDEGGRLRIVAAGGEHCVAAGDVTHVR